MVTGTLIAGGLLLLVGLFRSPTWALGDALSEEREPATTTTTTGGTTVKQEAQAPLVGSASRLIAAIGLLALASIVLGIGYAIIRGLMVDCEAPKVDSLGTYFMGGAALFAPYAFNQIKSVFETTTKKQ